MRHDGRAVVIGGSMGGLLAARALSGYFQHVTVLERDSFPEPDGPRKGVPQGRHAHGLLARGREALEDLFPGLTSELMARGALLGDLTGECAWHMGGDYLDQSPSGLIGLLVSRPLLEGAVRRRVLALPRARVVERCSVVGLRAGLGRMDGVCLASGETLDADLIVDASGRGSRGGGWLAAAGFEPPVEEKVEIGLGYTTRVYRRRPAHAGGKRAILLSASPPTWRTAAALAQEGDSWIVSLGGYLGDQAPLDERGFLEFARSLPVREIHEILASAEPLSDFAQFRYPANLRRRYERLPRFPEGYLAFGDALCSFDPVYGQGMTVAALEAIALRQCLSHGRGRLAQRFFRRASRLVDTPWQIAVGADLRHPAVEGARTAMVRFLNWYIGKLHLAARRDPVLTKAFLEVANLMKPPASILRPAMAVRVLLGQPGAGHAEEASGTERSSAVDRSTALDLH